MLSKRALFGAVCSVNAITLSPGLAQEKSTLSEYYPTARLSDGGQYRAEVWRRTNGQEDRAWAKHEAYPSEAAALGEACRALRQYFDASFGCAGASDQKAAEAQPGPATAAAQSLGQARGSGPQTVVVKAPGVAPPPTAAKPTTAPPTAAKKAANAAPIMASTQPTPPQAHQDTPEPKRSTVSSTNWAKEFWTNQSKWGHGGGAGGGSW